MCTPQRTNCSAWRGAPTSARPQRDQGRQEDQQKAKGQDKKNDKAQKDQDRKKAQGGRQAESRPQAQQRPTRLPSRDREERVRQQEQRLAQYRDHLEQQQRQAEQQAAELQRQNRRAQRAFQQQYLARLRQQHAQTQARHDYDRDPYFYTPPSHRYSRGGRYDETNRYGVDLLRQAVNVGYEEGFRAGRADRQDRWAFGYESLYAYQDANYRYSGFYVDRDDYNHYFRAGFRRGYEDGYRRRYQYGRMSNGKVAILAGTLAAILTFELIR